jgi:PPOX class probable F420-dependent enzyme
MPDLKQFEKQNYLNIETFRKNGTGVKTPVWFVQEGEKLYIWTESSSGKARRIRNTGKANIVPSKGDGAPVGVWVPAKAWADDAEASIGYLKALMRKKYGFAFSLFAILGKLRRSKYTAIRVEVV